MPELKPLFLRMAAILGIARSMAVAVKFAGQPEVVGEMIAGILLGPSLLGRISPDRILRSPVQQDATGRQT
jgi:Kef-type K+ transport system membrane component KefB